MPQPKKLKKDITVPHEGHSLADLMVAEGLAENRGQALKHLKADTVRINGKPFGMLNPRPLPGVAITVEVGELKEGEETE